MVRGALPTSCLGGVGVGQAGRGEAQPNRRGPSRRLIGESLVDLRLWDEEVEVAPLARPRMNHPKQVTSFLPKEAPLSEGCSF